MKKTIRDFNLDEKRVIIRVDFNVPMKNQIIADDNRIKESLETINYAINNNAKVILLSHLGRIKNEEDKLKNDLAPVAKRLSELLNKEVKFISTTKDNDNYIEKMLPGEVVLMQNTRYEDLEGSKESKNDPELGAYWASLGDVFINDAFGTSHRAHASNVGIAKHLPNGIGFLIEKELQALIPAIENPTRPLTVILGGSKVADKIGVINNLVNIADYILIGGGMAYTFLKTRGIEIGKSLVDEDSLEFCNQILNSHPDKIILPIDAITGIDISETTTANNRFINEIKQEEMGLDIGPLTVKLFKEHLESSKTIIWNGPVGVFEIDKFADGTKKICEILSTINGKTIIGGGDTASAAINFGYQNKFTHISTGGGASLELLEGKKLPGIEIINEK